MPLFLKRRFLNLPNLYDLNKVYHDILLSIIIQFRFPFILFITLLSLIFSCNVPYPTYFTLANLALPLPTLPYPTPPYKGADTGISSFLLYAEWKLRKMRGEYDKIRSRIIGLFSHIVNFDYCCAVEGTVASWLVRSTTDRAIRKFHL